MKSLVGIININCLMKKIILVLLIGLFGFNTITYCNNIEKSDNKDKRETTVTVKPDKVKNTIASMKDAGWTFAGMSYNKGDGTCTIGFYRYDKSKNFVVTEFDVPDGEYQATFYDFLKKKDVNVMLIVKNKHIVKRFEDGKEVNYETSELE